MQRRLRENTVKKCIMLMTALIILSGMATAENADSTPALQPEFTTFSELSGKTVSMLTGAPLEDLVMSRAPGIGELTFFNSAPDMIQALKLKKTDAVVLNNAVGPLALNKNPGLALFPLNLQDSVFGIAFAKGDK